MNDRPYTNIDERYGGDEVCNLQDYYDLNPDGDFIEEPDGIYEKVNETWIRVAVRDY